MTNKNTVDAFIIIYTLICSLFLLFYILFDNILLLICALNSLVLMLLFAKAMAEQWGDCLLKQREAKASGVETLRTPPTSEEVGIRAGDLL